MLVTDGGEVIRMNDGRWSMRNGWRAQASEDDSRANF